MRTAFAPIRVRWARRGAAIGVVISVALVLAPGAGAAEDEFSPTPTGYHSRTQDPSKDIAELYGELACQQPFPPDVCLELDQVTGGTPVWPREDNYVYVAQFAGSEDSIGVVGTSALFGLPFGSIITKITFDFQVENSGAVGTFGLDPEEPGLLICMATSGFAGGDGGSWDTRPETDCAIQSVPTHAATDGDIVTFTADLMPLAAAWADGRENEGFVIRPGREAPDNFQFAIRSPGVSPDGMRLRVTYTEPSEDVLDSGFVGGMFGFTDTTTEFTEGFPGVPGTPPSFSTAQDPPAPVSPVRQTRGRPNGDPQNRWWMFIGFPVGLALLGAMAQGVAAPTWTTAVERVGPVSRLMQQGAGLK